METKVIDTINNVHFTLDSGLDRMQDWVATSCEKLSSTNISNDWLGKLAESQQQLAAKLSDITEKIVDANTPPTSPMPQEQYRRLVYTPLQSIAIESSRGERRVIAFPH